MVKAGLQDGERPARRRRDHTPQRLGLDRTLKAHGFASYWQQSFSVPMAESIIVLIGGSQEAGTDNTHSSLDVN